MSKKTCAEWREEAIEKIQEYNTLLLDENATRKAVSDLKSKIDEVVGEYNAQSRSDVLKECAESDDPMMAAIRRLQYPRIAAKEVKIPDTDEVKLELADRFGDIDTYALHRKAGGIGKVENWWAEIEQLNLQLTLKTARELGIDPVKAGINDSFAMKELSKQAKLSDGDSKKDPTSEKNLLETLQYVINKMIGEEYRATAEDVKFLIKAHSKKDNKQKLRVACQNNTHFRQTIVDICHRIVMDGEYTVDYKKVKDKK